MSRLNPLWHVGSPPPTSSRGAAHLGTVLGLAVALLSTLWVTALNGDFRPWLPHLGHLDVLRHASEQVVTHSSPYAPRDGFGPFGDSPFAAWTALLIPRTGEFSIIWVPVIWALLHVLAFWLLARSLGLRGWRAGLLAAFLPNLEPLRPVISWGDPTVLLLLVITADLVFPSRAGDSPRPRRTLPRGLLTGFVIAWNPLLAPFAVVLWFAGRRRAAAVALGTSAAFTLLAALLSPRASLHFFTETLPDRFRAVPATTIPLDLSNQAPLAAWLRTAGGEHTLLPQLVLVLVVVAGLVAAFGFAARGHLLVAVGLAGVSPLLPQPWVLAPSYAAGVLGVLGLIRGRIPLATRSLGLIAFGWMALQPWHVLTTWPPAQLTPLQWLLANGGPTLLVLFFVVASVELLRRRTPASAPNRTERVVVRYVLTWLPFLAALFLAGTFFGSTLEPWRPQLPDFSVYAAAGEALVAGEDFYALPGWPFLYPPFAALLTFPMGIGLRDPSAAVLQLLNVIAYLLLFYRAGLRGWKVPFATTGAFLFIQVFEANVRMGNIHGLIVAMVFLDLVPGSGGLRRVLPFRWAQRERLIPEGVLTGLATSIKVLPILFIVQMVLTKRYRAALRATVTAAVTSLIGVIILPERGVRFAEMVLNGELNGAIQGPNLHYLSLVSGLQRWIGYTPGAERTATLISLAIGLIAFLASLRWFRAGHLWFGTAMCGIATIFMSPVAWNYYYLWLFPAALVVLLPNLDAPARSELLFDAPPPRRPPLPEPVAFLTIFLAGWMTFQFHLALPSENGIEFTYDDLARLCAATAPIGTALLSVVAFLAQRRRREAPTAIGDDQGDAPIVEQSGPHRLAA